jgi:hypothetical protein
MRLWDNASKSERLIAGEATEEHLPVSVFPKSSPLNNSGESGRFGEGIRTIIVAWHEVPGAASLERTVP